jgi:hypothetical protein
MQTSHFDRSSLPVPRVFYEDECGKLSRPSRGWARAACPLHGGKNRTAFSINLTSGGFFCHNCGAKGGDIIAFVMLRDRLDFVAACKQLGIWKGARINSSMRRHQQWHRERQELCAKTIADNLREIRLDYRSEIHSLERSYHLIGESLGDANPGDLEDGWAVLAEIHDQHRTAIAAYHVFSFSPIDERIACASSPDRLDTKIQEVIDCGMVRDDSGAMIEVDFSIGMPADSEGHGVELTFA